MLEFRNYYYSIRRLISNNNNSHGVNYLIEANLKTCCSQASDPAYLPTSTLTGIYTDNSRDLLINERLTYKHPMTYLSDQGLKTY